MQMDTDEVHRRAEARRAKLLQQQELRMKKILLGSRVTDSDDKQIVTTPTPSPSNCINNGLEGLPRSTLEESKSCDHVNNGENLIERESLPVKRSEIMTDSQPETELRHLIKTDGPHFPRKVSLISSPADFKTVQQNQANKDGLLPVYLYSMIISLHQLAYSLLPLLSLIFLAVIGSVKQYNFLIPFGTSQLIRIVHVFHNNPNGLSFKLLDVLSALMAHLIIFSTFYIAISVLIQQKNNIAILF